MKNWGNVAYAPSVSSDAFFLYHWHYLRAGMYLKKTMLFIFDCIKIEPK